MTPTNVALVIWSLDSTFGGERVAIDLCRGIASRTGACLVTLSGRADVSVLTEQVGCPVISARVPSARGLTPLRQVSALREVLGRHAVDAAIGVMNTANIITVLAAARRIPVLVTEHNTPSRSLVAGYRHPSAVRAAMRYTYPRARGIVAVSNAVADDLARTLRIPLDRVTTVYNPVDTDSMRRTAATRPCHPMLSPDRDTPVAVLVGNLKHAKGVDVAIEALASAATAPNLIVVGDGPLAESLRGQVSRLRLEHRVDFVGFREDAAAWIAAADVLVVPSRWEGFGLVAAEAAAVGTPVVGTRVGGLTEVLDHVGGISVPPDNPRSLAHAIDEAIREHVVPRNAWVDDLSPDRVATRYLTMLGDTA